MLTTSATASTWSSQEPIDAFVERQNGTPLEASSIRNVDEIGWSIGMGKQMILCRTNPKSTNTLNFNLKQTVASKLVQVQV